MPTYRSCSYAPCSAPVRILVSLAFGDLALCEGHWRDARAELEQCGTFAGARRLAPVARGAQQMLPAS